MPVTETLPAKYTKKEDEFCLQYAIDKNGARAARDSGYSEKTAKEIACKLLTKANIRTRIKELLAQKHEELDISQARITKEYVRLAFSDTRKLYNEDGTLKPITELDDDTAAAVQAIDVTSHADGAIKVNKIKLADKKAALDSLAKTFDMFGEGGGPLEAVAVEIETKDVAMRVALILRKAEK